MDFSFSSDQQLLKNSARAFLDEHCKPAQVRLLWDDPRGESEALWKEMAQLGWLGLALPEDAGGSALGLVETAILQEELGRAACPSPYLPTVLAAMAIDRFGSAAQKHRWLPAVAGGGARATVALMERALDLRPESIETRADERGGKVMLSGVKQFVPWAHVADVILVPAQRAGSLAVYLVEASAPGVSITPLTSMDPGTRLGQVTLDAAAVAAEAMLPAEAVPFLLERGAVGAAAEMLGAARRCLDMAVEYAKVREQFGQPIGSFQAIRHKCAEMLLGSRTRTRRPTTQRGRSPAAPRTARSRPRWRSRTSATPRARSAAMPSRCTAASASPGNTTCTSTSSARRRWSRSTATPSTTAS